MHSTALGMLCRSVVLPCLAALAASGCANFNLLSTEDEVRLGRGVAAQVEKKAKLCTDPVICNYVSELGARIAAVADRKDVAYSYKVIEDHKTVNAFAAPGGFIYVYTGLLLAADNEAELVGVLAHETGHVVAKHSAKHISNQIGMSLVLSVALGQNPGVLAELGGQLLAGAGVSRMSRQDEHEADQLGITYMKRAGYAPASMVEFLRKLDRLRKGKPSSLSQMFATHPLTKDRIARANALALRVGLDGRIGAGTYNLRLAPLKSAHPSPLDKTKDKKPKKKSSSPAPAPRSVSTAGEDKGQPAPARPRVAPDTSGQDSPTMLRNLTKGNVVASRLVVARTASARRRGLLGRANLEAGEGMLLVPCRSVHTRGMKFAIDVVFIDKTMKVVEIRPAVRPGTWSNTCWKARSTLELAAGAAAAKRLEVGDHLKLIEKTPAGKKPPAR